MPRRPASPAADVDARQLLQDLLAQGRTKTDIARSLGRSPRLLDFVLTGQKPGANLRQGLHELGQTGQVRTPPARRLSRTGTPARVRGRSGQPSVTPAVPVQTAGQQPAAPARRTARQRAESRSTDQPEFTQQPLTGPNTFSHQQTTLGPNGEREFHRIQVPRAHLAWNRERGREIVSEIVDRARVGLKRMQFTAWVEVGAAGQRQRRPVRVGGHGGYDAGDVARSITAEGDDPFGWLSTQVEGRYPELVEGPWTVVSVDIDVW